MGAFRELLDHCSWHPDQIGQSLVRRVELHPEPGREFVAETGVVHVAGGAGPGVNGRTVERSPPPVNPFPGIGDQMMGMQQRITRPAGPMIERRYRQTMD